MTQFSILVAGGAGFLGAHLCRRLLQHGHNVTCLDNFQTGSLRRIENLAASPNFKILHQSVRDVIPGRFDQIYNLASPASPPQYQKNPIETFKTNVLGTLNLLEFATANGSKLLQASTSEVYGDPLMHPQPETYFGNVNPTGVRACYDEGKRGAEALIYDFHRVHHTNVRVARIFNTYGPGMSVDDGRVISNFIVQALLAREITIYGDGEQTRSFCYCDDLIRGLIALMNADNTVFEPVNLGNPTEMNLLDLATRILSLTKSQSKITFHSQVRDDPRQRCPDITRATKLLNWKPTTSLHDGLKATIEYFRDTCAPLSKQGQ